MDLFTDGTTAATKADCEAAIATLDAAANDQAKRDAAAQLVIDYIAADAKLSAAGFAVMADDTEAGKVVVTFPAAKDVAAVAAGHAPFFAPAAAEIVNTHGGEYVTVPYVIRQDAIRLIGAANQWDEQGGVTGREEGNLARIATAL